MVRPQDVIVPFSPSPDDAKTAGSVSDYVLHEIARRIVDGEYRPGQRIVEVEVTRDLGVSRSSVREAFRRLENNRFIRIEPNRGATVATPNREDIVAQFRVREVIAGLGARMAAERIDLPGNRELARQLLQDVDDQLRAGLHTQHRKDNGRFHRIINDMSGMPQIGELLDQYNFPILHTIYFRDLAIEDWKQNLSDHLDIARAVQQGDGVAAEHFAKRHMHRMVDIAIVIAERLMQEDRISRFG